jgi:hypothetical protein
MLRRLFRKLLQPLRTFWKLPLGNRKDQSREWSSLHRLQRQHYHNRGWKGLWSLKVRILFAGLVYRGDQPNMFLYNYHMPIYYYNLCVNSIYCHTDTWNTATVNAAFDENTPANAKPFTVYVASKTEGERAAWKWVKNNKPAFVFNSVLPYYTVSKRMRRR